MFSDLSLVRCLGGRKSSFFTSLNWVISMEPAQSHSVNYCSMKGRKDKEWKEGAREGGTGRETTIKEGKECHHLPVFVPRDGVLNSCNYM